MVAVQSLENNESDSQTLVIIEEEEPVGCRQKAVVCGVEDEHNHVVWVAEKDGEHSKMHLVVQLVAGTGHLVMTEEIAEDIQVQLVEVEEALTDLL